LNALYTLGYAVPSRFLNDTYTWFEIFAFDEVLR
jgi:hypothetical protein